MNNVRSPFSALICLLLVSIICNAQEEADNHSEAPYLVVLGIAQDAGFPQAGCEKACCKLAWADQSVAKMVSCLGLIDPLEKKRFLFDATPDFPKQLQLLDEFPGWEGPNLLDGIFLTHAHIGHYTGLMHLGREVMGADRIPVFAMPRMKTFLETNGPWQQLVILNNIAITPLADQNAIRLSESLVITPYLVPHRDEYSETVGYVIEGPSAKAFFLPDIDKWHMWDIAIEEMIRQVDIALLDGTFFANGEIPGRDMSQIPHPFIEESMERFANLPLTERRKVFFIHLNHTNPLLQADSDERNILSKSGMGLAEEGLVFKL